MMTAAIRKFLQAKKPEKKQETVIYTGANEHITPPPLTQRLQPPKFYYENKLKRSSSVYAVLGEDYYLYDEFTNKRKRVPSIYSKISIPDTIQEMIDDIIESYGLD